MHSLLRRAFVLITILSLAASTAFTPGSALAQHVSCGMVLVEDTKLGNDLVDCPGDGLIIGADHITVDFNDHAISGTAAPGSVGIRNSGYSGVTIRDGDFSGLDIAGFEVGILLQDGNRNRVRRLFVEGARFGIKLVNAHHNRIEGNNARATTLNRCDAVIEAGIALINADHNRIRGNITELTDFGIALIHADHNRMEQNQAAPTGSDGNACDGIALFDSDDNRVYNNLTAQNRGLAPGGDGIFVASGSRSNLVRANLAILNSDDGIDVEDPTTTITTNTANQNDDLGIEAVAGVIDGGRNRAADNGNPAQCVQVICS